MISFFAKSPALISGLLCIGCAVDRQEPPADSTAPAHMAAQPEVSSHTSAEPCELICHRSVELKCALPREACRQACAEMISAPVCRAQMAAVMGCVIREPVENWECSEEQIAAIKDGFCQREQMDFLRCYNAAAAQ